jgi:RHS repeat-associated protein
MLKIVIPAAVILVISLVALGIFFGGINYLQNKQSEGQAYKSLQKEQISESVATPSSSISRTSYIYAGKRIASFQNNDYHYYHDDNLGSHSVITDTSGSKVSEFSNYPFGETLSSSNSKYQYTGKENDAETGLYYYGARYYNSALGRFTQADPILRINSNYAYAANNPFKYNDPTGKEEKPMAAIFYNANVPEFFEEAKRYMANNKDKYEFRVYNVYGSKTVSKAIENVNELIKSGRSVEKVVFIDHAGDRMFGMLADEWSTLPRIIPQENREMLLGTCYGGRSPLRLVFAEMMLTVSADSLLSVKDKFRGFSRNSKGDSILVANKETIYTANVEQILSNYPWMAEWEAEYSFLRKMKNGARFETIRSVGNPLTIEKISEDEYQVTEKQIGNAGPQDLVFYSKQDVLLALKAFK